MYYHTAKYQKLPMVDSSVWYLSNQQQVLTSILYPEKCHKDPSV